MLPRKHPDRIRVSFDDHHLVANAGLILCWPSPPEPTTCCWPGCARAGPTPPPAAPPTSCGKRRGGCALWRGQGTTPTTGQQRLLYPRSRRRLSRDGCPLLHHNPPAQKPAESDRGDTRGGMETHPLLDGAADVAETTCKACLRSILARTTIVYVKTAS